MVVRIVGVLCMVVGTWQECVGFVVDVAGL